jgi:hypothetical protein
MEHDWTGKAVTDDHQIAALREEIRRRWRSYRWLWGSTAAFGSLAFLVISLSTMYWNTQQWPSWLWGLTGISISGFLLLGTISSLYLWRAQRHIRALFDILPSAARVEALRPFLGNSGRPSPMSEVVSSFVRRAFFARELTPTAPDARGDEASPAEKER